MMNVVERIKVDSLTRQLEQCRMRENDLYDVARAVRHDGQTREAGRVFGNIKVMLVKDDD